MPTASAEPKPKFAAYPHYNPDPCYQAEDHDAADLCAQWRAAIAAEKAADEARRSTTWSAVATFLSAFSLAAVAIALKLTIDSNRIARDAIEGQLRPWINFKVAKHGTFEVVDGSLELFAQVTFENIGASPAIDLTYMGTMIIGSEVDPHFRKLIDQFRARNHDWSDKNLFPREKWDRNVVAIHNGKREGSHKVTYVVIARYRTPFSNTYRFTARAYDTGLTIRNSLGEIVPMGDRSINLSAIGIVSDDVLIVERQHFSGLTT